MLCVRYTHTIFILFFLSVPTDLLLLLGIDSTFDAMILTSHTSPFNLIPDTLVVNELTHDRPDEKGEKGRILPGSVFLRGHRNLELLLIIKEIINNKKNHGILFLTIT